MTTTNDKWFIYEPIKVAGIETLIANENGTVAEVRPRLHFRGIEVLIQELIGRLCVHGQSVSDGIIDGPCRGSLGIT